MVSYNINMNINLTVFILLAVVIHAYNMHSITLIGSYRIDSDLP